MNTSEAAETKEKSVDSKTKTLIIRSVVVLVVVIFAFWLSSVVSESEALRQVVRQYGYFGVLLASAVSGINIFVPIPIVSFVPLFVESGLNFWLTVLVIVVGVTAGDGVAYLLGVLGRVAGGESLQAKIKKLENLRQKHTWVPLVVLTFVAAFVPLPNEIVVIPLALMGYSWWKMAPFLLAGNAVFNILISFGFVNLFKLILG